MKGDRILPLFHLTVADKLSTSVFTMDKNNITPAFDVNNHGFRNSQKFSDLALGDAEFFSGLDAAK